MAKKQEAQHTIENPFEDDGKKKRIKGCCGRG